MPQQVDLTRGITALHDRLLRDIRCYAADEQSMRDGYGRVHASATALSLMLFGHNGMLEGSIRTAARHAASNFVAGMTDEVIIGVFLSQLPTLWDGIPVRERFFAGTYVPAAVDA